jgi:hypothetical protein
MLSSSAVTRNNDPVGPRTTGPGLEHIFWTTTGVEAKRSYPLSENLSQNRSVLDKTGTYETIDGRWKVEKKGYGPTYIMSTSQHAAPIYILEDAWTVSTAANLLAYLTYPSNIRSRKSPATVHILFTSATGGERDCAVPVRYGSTISITPVRHLVRISGTYFVDPMTCNVFGINTSASQSILSTDEQRLAVIGQDGLIVYDIMNSRRLLQAMERPSGADLFSFQDDNEAVALMSKDSAGVKHLYAFTIDNQRLVQEVCARVHRSDLSRLEWLELVDSQLPLESTCSNDAFVHEGFDNE